MSRSGIDRERQRRRGRRQERNVSKIPQSRSGTISHMEKFLLCLRRDGGGVDVAGRRDTKLQVPRIFPRFFQLLTFTEEIVETTGQTKPMPAVPPPKREGGKLFRVNFPLLKGTWKFSSNSNSKRASRRALINQADIRTEHTVRRKNVRKSRGECGTTGEPGRGVQKARQQKG